MKNLKPKKGKESKNGSGYVPRLCLNVMLLLKDTCKCAHNVLWHMTTTENM